MQNNEFDFFVISNELENAELVHEKIRRQLVDLEIQEKSIKLLIKDLRQEIEKLPKQF